MTTIEMPAEPDQDRVWTRDGDTLVEWMRGAPGRWDRTGDRGFAVTWPVLLSSGPVLLEDPKPADPMARRPRPWGQCADDMEVIVDATGCEIRDMFDSDLAAFVVRAVNAYQPAASAIAAAAGESDAQDAEIARLRDTLRLIDAHGCESFTAWSGARCSDPNSGKTRISTTGTASEWCDACRAADALAGGPQSSAGGDSPSGEAEAVPPAEQTPEMTPAQIIAQAQANLLAAAELVAGDSRATVLTVARFFDTWSLLPGAYDRRSLRFARALLASNQGPTAVAVKTPE